MNTIVLLFLAFCDGLLLPSDIGNVSGIKFRQDDMIIFDNSDQSLHLFDKNGQRKVTYSRVGQGPGEYTKLSNYAVTAGGYAILDHQQRRLIFLDETLQFLRQSHFQLGVAYDVQLVDDDIFLYLVSLSKNQVIHRFDARMNYQNSLGPSLADDPIPQNPGALFQFGAGQLSYDAKRDILISASYYFARISLMTKAGNIVKSFSVPTVPQDQPNIGIGVKPLMIEGDGHILVPLIKYKAAAETIKNGLWRLDPQTGSWSVYRGSFHRLVLKPDGTFIQAIQRDDERWILVPREISFESFP